MLEENISNPPTNETQFSAIYSNVLYHGILKKSARVLTILFVGLLVFIGVMQSTSYNPTTQATLTLFLIGSTNGIQMVIRLGEEREIGFSKRIGIFRVNYSVYLAAHIAARLSIALIQTGMIFCISIYVVPPGFSFYMTTSLYIVLQLSFIVGLLGTFGLLLLLSVLIKDPKVIPRAFPMLVSLLQMYPVLISLLKTETPETTVIDWTFAALSPQGYAYLMYKIILVQLRFDLQTVSFLLLGQLVQTVILIGLTFYIFSMTDIVVGRLGLKNTKLNLKKPSDSLENTLPVTSNILQVKRLTKKYGKFTALDNLDVELHPGIITCLLGHNGAGKTTLINTVLGLERPTSGEVLFNGKDLYKNTESVAGNIGYCSSDLCLFMKETLTENMLYWAVILNVSDPLMHIARIISACNLSEYSRKIVKNLSGGTQKRLSLAMAMIGNPSIIFLDEPTSGVDVVNREDVWEFIMSMKREDRIILFTTHHLEEAEILTDDVVIMHKGAIDVRGAPNELAHLYGVGYRFLILDIKDDTEMNGIVNRLSEKFPVLKINTTKFTQSGTIEVTLPSENKLEFSSILAELDSMKSHFKIRANTLEDAFISRGELKRSEHSKASSESYHYLLDKKYNSSRIGLVSMLFKRKMKSMIGKIDMLLRYFYMVMITPVFAVLITSIFEFSISSIVAFFAIFIFYALVSSNIFMQLIIEETFNERRHLLKLIGVDSVLYVASMTVYDFFIMLAAVVMSFILFILFNIGRYSFADLGNFLTEEIVWLLLGQMLWSISYILNAYNTAYFAWDDVRSLIYLPLLHILVSIPLTGVAVILLMLSHSSLITSLLLSSFTAILSPVVCMARILLFTLTQEVQFGDAVKNRVFGDGYFQGIDICGLLVAAIVYFAISILLDNRKTGFKSEGIAKAIPAHMRSSSGQVVIDQSSIEREDEAAKNTNPEIPLQMSLVSKKFKSEGGYFLALQDVSMVAERGQTVGLLGPNGAGKSTLFNLASTKYSIDYGRIKANGKNLSQFSNFYKNTGICTQKDSLWSSFTVREHLQLWKNIFNIPDEVSQKWLEILELNGFEDFLPSMLSTGMKRKLCFLLSIISNPLYKFMDECTTGVDPIARNIFKDVIENQRVAYGGTTIFTSHTMEEATLICNKLVVLMNGMLCAVGTPETLTSYTKGFHLTIFVAETDKEKAVEQIKNEIPESNAKRAEIDVLKIGQIHFRIDSSDAKIHEWAQKLDALIEDSVINDYSLASQGLADLFHKLSLHSKGRLGK